MTSEPTTAAGRALLENFEFVHKRMIEQALGARDKFEQEEWADIIGSDPAWRLKEALPLIEAEARADAAVQLREENQRLRATVEDQSQELGEMKDEVLRLRRFDRADAALTKETK